MREPLIIALQGREANGDTFAARCRLSEIASGIGGEAVLLDAARKDWPAGCDTSPVTLFDRMRFWRYHGFALQCSELIDQHDGPVVLLGHSDGATMALRLAITLRKRIAAVVGYAGLYDHWQHHEDTPSEAWPPALLLNNEHDALVCKNNAINIFSEWENRSASFWEYLPGPEHPPATKLKTHIWQPDAANPIVVEWLRDVLASREVA